MFRLSGPMKPTCKEFSTQECSKFSGNFGLKEIASEISKKLKTVIDVV